MRPSKTGESPQDRGKIRRAAELLVADQHAASDWKPVWTVAVELCVHVQARAFGFQVVNASQEDSQQGKCTPATSAVAADHLVRLLKDRAAVIAAEDSGQKPLDEVFEEAIGSLHAAYFAQGPYQSWKAKSNVTVLDKELMKIVDDGDHGFTGVAHTPEWVQQLAHLSLYFLLWSEAANLRHTPELLWLLYHLMLSSKNFDKACGVLGATAQSHYSLLRWLAPATANGHSSTNGSDSSVAAARGLQPSIPLDQLDVPELQDLADDLLCYERVCSQGFVRGVLLPVRNALGNAARVGALLQEGPGPYQRAQPANGGADLQRVAGRQIAGLQIILTQPGTGPGQQLPEGAWGLAQLVLEDFAFFGDGCIFLDMVIQPVFNMMAEQICLMGDMKESPALRLGFDDFNESACMPEVMSKLVMSLKGEGGADPWDCLLRRFITSHAAVEATWVQGGYSEALFKPATPKMQQRYPRDKRRLEELAAKLRDAGAGGQPCSDALERKWLEQGQQDRSEWMPPSTGGSMPVVHLHASLRVTDDLWADLFKKSFVETRSIAAVAVAFSRVYMLHSILLCWVSLLAYRVPELSLSGPTSIFKGGFWQQHGLTVADCISWGVFLHAVLHVIKDLLILDLLVTPSAVRYQLDKTQTAVKAKSGWLAKLSRSGKRAHAEQYDDRIEQIVQPPVHGGPELKLHNVATLLFWLACCVVLLDSHVPAWPLNKVLTEALKKPGQQQPTIPVWALMSLVYVGLWLLHWLSGALSDKLRWLSSLRMLARKDSRRAAEHYFPYGAMPGSQSWPRFVTNTLLWALVLLAKVLFDFFVVLQPLATGPVSKLLMPLDSSMPWSRWAESILAVWSLWVAAAFLVFYDTGLFWQLISALYSTLFLGMRRRIGHVKTWYDLVWAFPRLSYKFNQRMIPEGTQQTKESSGGGAASKAAVEAAAPAGANGPAAGTSAGAATETSAAAAAVKALQLVPLSQSSEVVFSQAWNQIVDDLRSRDLLSNAEAANLKYLHLGWGQGRQAAWLLLPKFVTAGAAIEAVGQRGLTSQTQIEVITRCFNWLVWLLAALNMLKEDEVPLLLLAPSKRQAGPKGTGPREASAGDLMAAAEVLVRSKELLETLSGRLAAADIPFCPLAAKPDPKKGPKKEGQEDLIWQPTKPDVNTQMLLAETLGAVAALARSSKGTKLTADEVAAIKARPRTYALTGTDADPCCDLQDSKSDQQRHRIIAAEEAAQLVEASKGQGEEVVKAAQQALAQAQKQLKEHVLDPRKRRRQLYSQVVGWLLDMLKHTRGEAVPKSAEAVRALTFFATSLNNPFMPTAQPIALTRSMTTLTPHYGEGVLYALSETAANQEMGTNCGSGGGDDVVLLNEQEEPTETLNYLRIVYAKEWANFQERLLSNDDVRKALGAKATPAAVKEAAFLPDQPLHAWRHELLAWASMRGQLLQRTVHGMMYYETALQQLILMQSRPQLTRLAREKLALLGPASLRDQHLTDGWADQVAEEAALLLAREKYSYVVSSQVLGEKAGSKKVMERWLAHGIRSVLTKSYPSLQVAYIDLENLGEVPAPAPEGREAARATATAGPRQRAVAGKRERGRGAKDYQLLRQYSVLLQHDDQLGNVVELYRVRLPINLESDKGVILGEGKPENQNHAIIFCHSEAVQTIDCNQDGFLVEALKLPNLLAEFERDDGKPINVRGSISKQQKDRAGLWARCFGSGVVQGPALLGFREWIFSEDSGALAVFAAATERSFGTTVQRVMHNPGGCRFHYGHPDVWDKLFTMTNGGVSKATRSLHVSEDVFGGYNVMLRGRDIIYVDYVAVGKGRDMGFETINTFEAKVGAGNGEQVVSRDVSRLARRMNMPRLLSWYFTGNGFFINTALLMFSMLVNAWLCLLLVLLSGVSRNTTVLADSLAVVGGLQLLQLGSLSLLVYVASVWLESGFFTAIKNVLKQFVAGSMFFYIFRGQTSAHAFRSDLAFGGAAYAATGRGYKLKATPFLQVFMRYGRSHMWFGAHLLILLIVALCLGLRASFLAAWANVVAILALLVAPFWFNPFSLDWQTNKEAANEWLDWMAGHKPAATGDGKKLLWRQYNDRELEKAADDAQRQLNRSGSNVLGLLFMLPSFIIICVAVYGMLEARWGGIIVIALVNGSAAFVMACWHMATVLEAVRNPVAAVMSRSVKFVLSLLMVAAGCVLFAFMVNPATNRNINLFRLVVRVLLVEFEMARLIGRLLIAFLPKWQPARRIINSMCWLADFALGLLLLLLLFIGSLFGLLTRYQAAVLFSMGYAAHYLAEEGLKHSEVGRLAKQLKDLQRQEREAERIAARDAPAAQAQDRAPAGGSQQDPRGPGGPAPGGSGGGGEGDGGAPPGGDSSGGGGGGGGVSPAGTQHGPMQTLFISTRPWPAHSADEEGDASNDSRDAAATADGPSTATYPPILSNWRAFLLGQQQQPERAGSSWTSSIGLPESDAPVPAAAAAAGSSSRSRLPPAAGSGASLHSVAERAALESSLEAAQQPAASASEVELQRWNVTLPPADRVFGRSDSEWTVDQEDGPLPLEIVREASEAAARASSAGSMGIGGGAALSSAGSMGLGPDAAVGRSGSMVGGLDAAGSRSSSMGAGASAAVERTGSLGASANAAAEGVDSVGAGAAANRTGGTSNTGAGGTPAGSSS